MDLHIYNFSTLTSNPNFLPEIAPGEILHYVKNGLRTLKMGMAIWLDMSDALDLGTPNLVSTLVVTPEKIWYGPTWAT